MLRNKKKKKKAGQDFFRRRVSAAGLQSGKRKMLIHSVRKTSIGKLLSANVPENYVNQLGSHMYKQIKRVEIGFFWPPTPDVRWS